MIDKVLAYNKMLKEALETVYNELNKGQQNKILNNKEVKALLVRYGVIEGD